MSEEIQKVDYRGITEIPAGAVANSKITSILKGTQGEFRTDAYYAASTLSKSEVTEAKQSAAIQVTTENNAVLVINMPKKGEDGTTNLHPKSTLALFKRKYGKFPEVDMELATQLDQNGFWRIVM